jgi:hypothetical protein
MAYIKRNSFPEARINGYVEGLLGGLYRMSNTEATHKADRTIDYIQWFTEAFQVGYEEGLTFDVPMILFTDEFKTGFVQGWKEGYNFGYNPTYEVVSVSKPTKSYLKGFDFGMYDGESQGSIDMSNEERCMEMQYNPYV